MSATWCWVALVDDRPHDCTAAAPLAEAGGSPAGWLAAWQRRAKPVRHARRADARIVDAGGDAGWISLVLPPVGMELAFDDLAVQQARRDVLARPAADLVTTLLRDASHFEGAITLRRGDDARRRLRDDPFARVFPARILHVGDGLLGSVPAPAGPTIERYGSAQPWPRDRF